MWKEAAALEVGMMAHAVLHVLHSAFAVEQDFPKGQLDESRQPLDLSVKNSWTHG